MNFPACKHKKHKATGPRRDGLRWLASEPYRLFFFSGALWSIIGVALWPLYYAQQLGFYPGFVHARIMIEAFGAAFVVGFLVVVNFFFVVVVATSRRVVAICETLRL